MNRYELSREMLKVREKFSGQEYNEQATEEYFRETVKCLGKYFKKSDWCLKYLFCSIGYFDNNKTTLTPYDYNLSEMGKNSEASEYHKGLIEQLRTWINKDRSISITQMFLHPKTVGDHNKALLYNASRREFGDLEEFIYFNLLSRDWRYAGSLEEFNKKPFGSYDFQRLFVKKGKGNESNPYQKITSGNPTDEDSQQFDKLISVFTEISNGISENCYFYFLKPVTFQNTYNVVLLLGLKKEMSPDEIEINLDLTRAILSPIAEKKVIQVELLRNISASSHVLKTTINTSFSPPLNSLKSDPVIQNDYRIRLLSEAKEMLLQNAELINLLSKLSITSYSDESKARALLDSELFSSTHTPVNLKELLGARLEIFHLDKTGSQKQIRVEYRGDNILNKLFLCYENLFPSEKFYKMILGTIIENCNRYAKSINYLTQLIVEVNDSEIIFSNLFSPADNEYKQKQFTGNILIINTILLNLGIGSIDLETKGNFFYTGIFSNAK